MITEAASSGFYQNDFWKKKYPRLQILTVRDVLKGKRPDMPWGAALRESPNGEGARRARGDALGARYVRARPIYDVPEEAPQEETGDVVRKLAKAGAGNSPR